MSYKLLSVNSNPKIDKSNKVSSKYWSCIMHLRPVNTKICPYQDIAGCKSACLNTAGLGGVYPSIQKARQKKTDLFLDDREEFMQVLVKDIHTFLRACKRKDKKPAIRLNGTSDIQWEYIEIDGHANIFEMFPDIQFYDYTKIPTRKVEHIPNYHLTWSYSESNDKYAGWIDRVKDNIAVVFRTKDLPETFKGRGVIDGDLHDMRFLDEPNSVVGLKAKGQAKKDTSGFVIDVLQIA
jgi:hypothetical protein